MSVTRKRSPRMAAALSSLVLGSTVLAGSLAAAPSNAAAPVAAVQIAQATTTVTPETVVSRISLRTGPSTGGDKLLITGKKLATSTVNSTTGAVTWTAKAVKFGTITVPTADVTALSATALQVTVPAATDPTKYKVNVLVGDAIKGPVYLYVAPAVTVATTQTDLSALTPLSETGLAGQSITGTGFNAKTRVVVGGKVAKLGTKTGTTIPFTFPMGLAGVQDVVVVDPRNSVYVGYVTYVAKKPTVTAAGLPYVVTEAPTKVTLTGTDLNQVSAVTYEYGSTVEKAPFQKFLDATKLVVTVPAGAATSAGTLRVTTRYQETATVALNRQVSAAPTVTGVSGVVPGTAGIATITGTNLVGLKGVKLVGGGKTYTGTTIVVKSATEATVKLPGLPNDTKYVVTATTQHATPATFDYSTGTPVTPDATSTAIDSTKKIVTLTGAGFKGSYKVVVSSGSTVLHTVTSTTLIKPAADGSSVKVTLPAALADGTYGVVVHASGGVSASETLTVGTVTPAPTATSAAHDATAATITVTGTNLTGTSKITLSQNSAVVREYTASFTVAPDGTTVSVPVGAALTAGTYSVVVTTPGGSTTAVNLVIA